MSQKGKWEYFKAIYGRYREAGRRGKRVILDEICLNTGYHRKYAIRPLNGPPPEKVPRRTRRRRTIYSSHAISILTVVWEAAGYPWSVKLAKKVRVGSRLRRVYELPQTPFQRVVASPQADFLKVAQLKALLKTLDPFGLARTVDRKLDRIYRLANGRLSPKAPKEFQSCKKMPGEPQQSRSTKASSVTS